MADPKELPGQFVIEQLHPELRNLYIPQKGEVIHWGKGTAIVTTSPLDNPQDPLLVISLNAGIHGPFEVRNSLCMGPYEEIPIDYQEQLIVYYDRNFDGRFTTLFQKHPDVKTAWESYRERVRMESPTGSPAQNPQ